MNRPDASLDATAGPVMEPLRILVVGVGLYVAAATATLVMLRPILGELLDVPTAPQLTVMGRGLQRLLIAFLYVPSVAAILTIATLWVSGGPRRRKTEFLAWLYAGFFPFALEHIGNAIVVFLRDRPTNPAEVIALTNAFSPGPRLVAETFDWTLGPHTFYWLSAFSLAGLGAVYCWGRALIIASADESGTRTLRAPDRFDRWTSIARAGGVYVIAVAIVSASSAVAIRTFLSLFG